MKKKSFSNVLIPVEELEVGMHVVKLDRPWKKTSFLLKSFTIKTSDVLQEVQRECDHVYIQVPSTEVKTIKAQLDLKQKPSTAPKNSKPLPDHLLEPSTPHKQHHMNSLSFHSALPDALHLFTSARSFSEKMIHDVRLGKSLRVIDCQQLVGKIVDSVLKNSDALKYLTLIKNKEHYTSEHNINVAILSAVFARHLGLLEYEIKTITLCGLIHDIGKCKIPVEVLDKVDKLTKDEAHLMAQHASFGRDIIKASSGELQHESDVAFCHHERMDGNGYPQGLVSNQVSYYSKIISIIDAYDAMTSDRSFAKAKTSFAALKTILNHGDTQFDSKLAKEFIRCIGFYYPGCLVELEAGQIAIIDQRGKMDSRRPIIRVITDSHYRRLDSELILDLSEADNQSIVIKRELPNKFSGIETKEYLLRALATDE